VLEQLAAVGLEVGDMWGMTEAVMTTMSPPRTGTVGKHFPHVELRVADDGELLIRGPNTFTGYRKDHERTAETLDADGWVHSGDLGAVSALITLDPAELRAVAGEGDFAELAASSAVRAEVDAAVARANQRLG
jgi:long-subunit acyl-CoA synthetase (AMP-forming)